MSETTNQISRREILKRGAFVGGAVVWATPVVQTLGMGRAFAATPSDTCVASWADKVESSDQGVLRNGDPVGSVFPERTVPENALGAPDDKFFSLGFGRDGAIGGGSIVLRLGTPYYSGKNGEAVVVETTFGSYPLEAADVYVGPSATGPWTMVGTAKNTNSPSALQMPLDGVGGLPSIITHILLIDQTDPGDFPLSDPELAIGDAFDVNAVGISCPTPAPSPV